MALATASAEPMAAQVVERHLPPAPVQAPTPLGEQAQPTDTNDSPIGPHLDGIVLLGPGEAVPVAPASGVTVGRLALPRRAALVRALTALLGPLLSRELIGEARTIVSRSYRRARFPFVSVTTPEQELTGGTLSLHVIEFAAGHLRTRSPSATVAGRAEARVRFPAGGRIDAGALQKDLAWLDRYPFHRTSAVFSAGDTPGTTDLTITIVPTHPWQGDAGISSSDAPSTGATRLSVGAVAGGLLGPESIVSAQATTSGFEDPRYLGLAARITEPLGIRHDLSLLLGYVRSNASAEPFTSRGRTVEGSLDLRFALPPAWIGDGHLGIEAGQQRTEARFGGARIFRVDATTLALFARTTAVVPIHGGTLSADVALHVSPGGIGRDGRADHLFFGQDHAGSATYAYLTADAAIDRTIGRTLTWQAQLVMQAGTGPLPGLDQIGLGGSAYVRGYTLDDGGYDNGIVIRNALLVRTWTARQFAPYGFTDWGHGANLGAMRRATFGSIGAGIRRALGRKVQFQAEAALPLLDGQRTKAMHVRPFIRVDLTF